MLGNSTVNSTLAGIVHGNIAITNPGAKALPASRRPEKKKLIPDLYAPGNASHKQTHVAADTELDSEWILREGFTSRTAIIPQDPLSWGAEQSKAQQAVKTEAGIITITTRFLLLYPQPGAAAQAGPQLTTESIIRT